jgi:hypothetical protein
VGERLERVADLVERAVGEEREALGLESEADDCEAGEDAPFHRDHGVVVSKEADK